MHVLCFLREKYGGLSGGISTAHHNQFFAAADLRFHKGGRIVDPKSFILPQVFNGEPPIFSSRRNDDCPRSNDRTIADLYAVRCVFARQPGCLFCNGKLSSKLLSLVVGSRRKLLARNAVRESEVVFNLGACACLA